MKNFEGTLVDMSFEKLMNFLNDFSKSKIFLGGKEELQRECPNLLNLKKDIDSIPLKDYLLEEFRCLYQKYAKHEQIDMISH
jgi:hypothetical protein